MIPSGWLHTHPGLPGTGEHCERLPDNELSAQLKNGRKKDNRPKKTDFILSEVSLSSSMFSVSLMCTVSSN